jgi:hypothetical protein
MKFTYKISLELELDFEAPLLGADTTVFRRTQSDKLFKDAVKELLKDKKQTVNSFNKNVDEENLKGTIKGLKYLQSSTKK